MALYSAGGLPCTGGQSKLLRQPFGPLRWPARTLAATTDAEHPPPCRFGSAHENAARRLALAPPLLLPPLGGRVRGLWHPSPARRKVEILAAGAGILAGAVRVPPVGRCLGFHRPAGCLRRFRRFGHPEPRPLNLFRPTPRLPLRPHAHLPIRPRTAPRRESLRSGGPKGGAPSVRSAGVSAGGRTELSMGPRAHSG